ncbi:glycosyltransferase family 4 protein [Paenibacillus pini]|uniref:Glycosyl transferase family 1 domain-containing protein n=1 Tax=Paenibacillus pini JCM 16418 TaxID=1236976 RepID=W7YM79_9BACL|nr:glycosyltransferase family 4 protein [Paenibacillus pini]GAF08698.1 hypothetical protein JCM16418_2787 [Paenibacillus pini JCM 16418]
MKILFTFYIPNGGVETLNRLRNQALRQLGMECHFLYLQSGVGMQNITDTFIYTTSLDEEIANIIALQQFDAVVVTSDVYLPERLRRLHYKGPIIYEVQGLGTKEEAIQTLHEGKELLQAHCCAALMPPTSHLVELVTQICPLLPKFIYQNPLNTVEFSPLSVPKHPSPIVGWVGRLEPNKNWRECLEIIYWLIVNQSEIEAWMFIDMSLATKQSKEDFFNRVTELGLENKVNIFPNVLHNEMPYYYSIIAESSGLLLSTSIMEGFGYAVAEALSCSCPVLSTDSDGVRSFIIHNVTGKFYEKGQIPQAVREAFELIHHSILREQIRSQARKYMITHFDSSQYASSFLDMMHALNIY